MAVPNIFASATSAIPLSQLDQNFATAITLGNTAVYLGNTTTSLGNVTLTNVTISSGNVTLTGANVSGTANVSTLIATGSVTLGDASTDLVTINGYMGVGGAVNTGNGIRVTSTALIGPDQSGILSLPTITSAATNTGRGVGGRVSTAATAFTVADLSAFYAFDAVKGAGSTITNQHGLYIVDQTQGTNNYGITSLVSSGTNKWNIYASGTADNYFAGNVGIGTTNIQERLTVQNNIQITNSASNLSGIYFGTNANPAQRYSYIESDGRSTGYINFNTNAAERMRIDSSGNVGIGTTAPNYLFSVQANSVQMGFSPQSGVGYLGNYSNVPLGIVVNNAEKMRVDSAGNVQVQAGAVMPYAPAPASISAAATLTNANIQAQIISATGTTYTITMPLGTTLETLATWVTTGIAYDFYVINTASGTITMAVNTGVTSLGTLTIATGVSAQFRIRRTAANTFVLYRLG